MAEQPPATQRPQSFHPDFETEVVMVVFSVEGEGFKADIARLSQHSPFLRKMFGNIHDRSSIGLPKEGTVDHPIIVEGITKDAFANFLGWLNHNSWSPHYVDHSQQLLDILHISHMWEIMPGIKFASEELLKSKFRLRPAHRLGLARRYGLVEWTSWAIRTLLLIPLCDYTEQDRGNLGYDLYTVLAIAKEAIDAERKRLAILPPYPKDLSDAPYCDPQQHSTCKKVWIDRWFVIILRRIHHASEPLPILLLPEALEAMEHQGMKKGCKEYIISWLKESDHVKKEEKIILATIDRVHTLFNIK